MVLEEVLVDLEPLLLTEFQEVTTVLELAHIQNLLELAPIQNQLEEEYLTLVEIGTPQPDHLEIEEVVLLIEEAIAVQEVAILQEATTVHLHLEVVVHQDHLHQDHPLLEVVVDQEDINQ